MGNDDFSSMNRAFGGVVPAMMWNRIMLYAHQNTTIKPLFGVENSILSNSKHSETDNSNENIAPDLPQVLSPASSKVIKSLIEEFQKAPLLTPASSAHVVSSSTSEIR